ncbi:MAG TPA: hypothetical protein VM122_03810 [Usitatibacter sp.]|nr:hypothetical protein [Usitatibacter sp.]
MPRLKPPSWPWLLAQEARLLWRSGGIGSWMMAAITLLFFAAVHLAGWLLLRQHSPQQWPRAAPGAAILITLFTVLLVLAAAFALAVRALFERRDLELLISAPVPTVNVFAVRGLGVAVSSVAAVAIFVLPIANMGPFVGKWWTLAAYPALLSIGLLCAAAAFAGTLLLVRWLGVARARIVAQLTGAFLGAALVLAMQLEAFLPRNVRAGIAAWARSDAAMGWIGADSPLLLPARAMVGEPWPLAALVALGVAAFAAVVRATSAGFVRAVQDAPIAAAGRSRDRGGRARPFRHGLARVVIAKELTLIARDPSLFGKALLQVIYLVPLFLVLARGSQAPELMAPALILLASGIAGVLAWISVSGEEAPQLLGSAPVSLERLRWLKVGASLLPVAALVLPFLAWYAYHSPPMALVVALFLAAALAGSAFVHVWSTPLGATRDFKQRARQNVFLRIADNLSSLGWAAACYLALQGWWFAVAGVVLGLLAPACAWAAGRRRLD